MGKAGTWVSLTGWTACSEIRSNVSLEHFERRLVWPEVGLEEQVQARSCRAQQRLCGSYFEFDSRIAPIP